MAVENTPIGVATVDVAMEIVDEFVMGSLTGGKVWDIVIFDHDKDRSESAAILMSEAAKLDGEQKPGGVGIVLDPLTPSGLSYVNTGFNDNSIALGLGDFNGDRLPDVAVANRIGEFILLLGKSDGTFESVGRTWQLVSVPENFSSRVHGIDAGDINGDGLAEVWIGDIGSAPTSLCIFNNISR